MMKLLDLFCGAGGVAMGYYLAGFDIVGVDIVLQPRYPFQFIQGDALHPPVNLHDFNLIHASPPCQRFSQSRSFNKIHNRDWRDYPDLLTPCREMLLSSGVPFVIENVPGAPMRTDVMLCGTMFGLKVFRHRLFEISLPKTLRRVRKAHQRQRLLGEASEHMFCPLASSMPLSVEADLSTTDKHTHKPVLILTPPCNHNGTVANGDYVCVVNNGGIGITTTPYAKKKECAKAMGIDWMTRKELTQSVPPAYTEFLGKHLIVLLNLFVGFDRNFRNGCQNQQDNQKRDGDKIG